ncbi:hypothetical protein LR48_Vigan02g261400 [Vigna angularis]|uniref:Uncharacterized protein n=2 Tax=Phaseolus angularis TaxID=3914 RepID=A0A0L9U246_PHAAN|nr:hypothetical protein LR48_Vigan02g261400 [Vigna angularis]BAT89339.1 hypothetical protein VIGAN_06027100 [Vigna angularis var. angularis]
MTTFFREIHVLVDNAALLQATRKNHTSYCDRESHLHVHPLLQVFSPSKSPCTIHPKSITYASLFSRDSSFFSSSPCSVHAGSKPLSILYGKKRKMDPPKSAEKELRETSKSMCVVSF